MINLLYTCIEIIGNGESEKDVAERGERAMVSPYSWDDFVEKTESCTFKSFAI